ncbi:MULTISPECIES: sigma-70 family RNA polymerase sigma factor [unclassified Rhodococcus (in: high G+C Gram-positive bacteria)]|uniref:RNA polymerase sigma factor n=1 Tax=Rhodococcus sp. OK519 TaxID=2135729 RepID=UPI0009F1C73D|nr:sigma-70 family RNA polymerase sigma factor [Prescottella equi]NKW46231.1 sigma-70 family RNA polymerase sigma factor [Prescottella equi]
MLAFEQEVSGGRSAARGLTILGAGAGDDPQGRVGEFEQLYRAHVHAVTRYFSRRTSDPQVVADLTGDTFTEAIASFDSFDPARGAAGGWIFGIARRVFAQHCESAARRSDADGRLNGRRALDPDEIAELVDRIDAETQGRRLLDELAALSSADRDVIELVDLAGLTPKDAAAALGQSPGALRIRLFRARNKLRTTAQRP